MAKTEAQETQTVRVLARIDIPEMDLPAVVILQEEFMELLVKTPQARLEVSMLPVTEPRD